MIRYLGRRVGHGLLMLFGVSILLFLLFQAAPGDFLSEVKLNSQISPETMAQLRAQYGLDQSLPIRYWRWAKSSARGDFGYSFSYNAPAASLLWPRARNTLLLSVPALMIGSLAIILRHVRASVSEVLESSYMRAAEGHGLPRFKLLFRYALPAAANPLISLFGLSVAVLLSVSLLIEVVMSWPGIGPLLLEAILARDLFLVIGAVMLSTVFLIAGNLLGDVLLYAFDPRIRRGL